MNEKEFTAREVAVLVERLEGKFQFALDILVPLREDMSEVKERLTSVEERLGRVDDGLRVGFPSINARLSALEAKVG